MPPLDDDSQIEVWNRRMAGLAAQTFQPDAKLVELLGSLNLKPQRALDLGCGPGRHLVWLAHQDWEVTGVDWSPQALEDAQRALDERGLNGTLLHGDIRTPPEFAAPFQLAVATRVFHHGLFRDYEQSLRSLRRLLDSPGHAIISLPSAELMPLTFPVEWIEERTLVPTEGDEKGVPHHFFTPDEVRQSASAFATVDIHVVREEYEEDTNDGPQIIRREWLWVVLGT